MSDSFPVTPLRTRDKEKNRMEFYRAVFVEVPGRTDKVLESPWGDVARARLANRQIAIGPRRMYSTFRNLVFFLRT